MIKQEDARGIITISEGRHSEKGLSDGVDVVCSCGEIAFELRYGEWELFARCPKCGAEESVYSG